MIKEYEWHGRIYRIDEKDLKRFPGAVPVKTAKTPSNKARNVGNKAGEGK